MTIILLTPRNLIMRESGFEWQPGGTITNGFEMPQEAGRVLDLLQPRALKVLPHYSTAIGHTYGFVWERVAYRVVADLPGAPVPLVLTSLTEHAHWQACKGCRDGLWCDEGMGLIAAAVEGGAV